jgi:hypothetical protein
MALLVEDPIPLTGWIFHFARIAVPHGHDHAFKVFKYDVMSGANSHGKFCRFCRPLGRSLPREPPATAPIPTGAAHFREWLLPCPCEVLTRVRGVRSGPRLRELGGPLQQATIRGFVNLN